MERRIHLISQWKIAARQVLLHEVSKQCDDGVMWFQSINRINQSERKLWIISDRHSFTSQSLIFQPVIVENEEKEKKMNEKL